MYQPGNEANIDIFHHTDNTAIHTREEVMHNRQRRSRAKLIGSVAGGGAFAAYNYGIPGVDVYGGIDTGNGLNINAGIRPDMPHFDIPGYDVYGDIDMSNGLDIDLGVRPDGSTTELSGLTDHLNNGASASGGDNLPTDLGAQSLGERAGMIDGMSADIVPGDGFSYMAEKFGEIDGYGLTV
jgi:hypothetical protein